MKRLLGVTTAMVTVFDQEDRVDVEGTKRLVDFLIDSGVDCLYPLGTTGEMLKMTLEERRLVAKTVVSHAAGRCTVYIHTGAHTLADTIELSKHALEIGADGIGVVTPSFFGLNEREFIHYYKTIADALPADFPLYLYNIPQCAANDLTPEIAAKIAKVCPNVVGIKYSGSDMLRTNEYLAIRGHNFDVVQGTDRLFLPALAAGCTGVVSGVSSVYPEPFVKIYKAWQAGDMALALQEQRRANDVIGILRAGSNISYFKHALSYRGVVEAGTRLPQLGLTVEEEDSLVEELRLFEGRA